ncbi:MAG: CpXC domain-containing protein [Fidelibacterota bacterium]
MSIHEHRTVNCPKCQHEQTIHVWSSINATLNPEGRNRLFDGQINRFTCSKCGYESLIPLPLLYHDPERRIAAHYFPPESMKKAEFLDQFDIQGKFLVTGEVDFEIPEHLLDIHVVFDMNELIRYILFREMLIEFHQQNSTGADPSLN